MSQIVEPMPRSIARERTLNFVGVTASAACMAHCLAIPVVALLAPLAASALMADMWHFVFAGLAAPLALFAVIAHVRAGRGSWLTMALAILGAALVVLGAAHVLSHDMSHLASLIGGLSLVIAHAITLVQLTRPRMANS